MRSLLARSALGLVSTHDTQIAALELQIPLLEARRARLKSPDSLDAWRKAIGPKTKAIVPVHYAGVGCEMDSICALAARRGIALVGLQPSIAHLRASSVDLCR